MQRILKVLCGVCVMMSSGSAEETKAPVKIAVVGLSHDHAFGFFPKLKDRPEVKLVGVVEADPELVSVYMTRFGLSQKLFYQTVDDLLARGEAQAVAIFTSTFEHPAVVEKCAAKHVDVMMEKPLAVNMEHAKRIEAAAKAGNIEVMVNYETTWYAANRAAIEMARDRKEIGEIRRIVVHDGHRGPKEIGCSKHFLEWLTDPVKNGGGAMNDFGCYGADLATWIMEGQRPLSVFSLTQHIKPDVYPKVEDEATIVVSYPKAQAIFQASWNWPYNRKDMEIYGRDGYVLVPNAQTLKVRPSEREVEKEIKVSPMSGPEADPVSYLAAVVRREIQPSGLSSLSVNMTVVEILDAARESAKTGKRVDFEPE